MAARPKATPRSRPKPKVPAFADNPGLTGSFPSTNYTKIVDDSKYQFPAPEATEPTRKAFADTPSSDADEPKTSDGYGHGGHEENLDGPNHEPKAPTKFSAEDWHDKLSADDIFRPTDSQMRKSPSKLSRNGSKPTSRGRGMSRGLEQESSSSTDRVEEAQDKAAAFQKGKLPADWASKVKTPSTQAEARSASDRTSHGSHSTDDSRDRYVVVEEDIMDVDDSPPVETTPNGIHPTTAKAAHPTPRRSSPDGGVDLRDFTQHAPFVPTASGLKGLDDLAAHLPFESKAEEKVDKPSARLRALNLPKPPKVVVPPAADRLDQANFLQYVDNMNTYMRDWNVFNAKMIEHFRGRQDRVCGTMSQSWVSMLGDGPDADKLEEDVTQKAGYAAYMQWLKDDAQCRQWWDHANEKHLQCLEDLGRIREVAKKKLRPA